MSKAKTIVFVETSLSHQEAEAVLPDAVYRPSARKGDVLRAIKEGYTRIAIIDGNFGWTPAVWHKEILIALDYGIEVLGASSMGALRAAELDVYGMQGVGDVYNLYKTGVVDGDDEVAIAYSARTFEQTVPLINLRVTLDKLQLEEKESILKQIRSIYYAERTWLNIAEILPETSYHLIHDHYIDIKKQDALFLLRRMRCDPLQNTVLHSRPERAFTLFEKNLIESVFTKAIRIESELEEKGSLSQLIRAKNLIKLLSMAKTRKNLLYYQRLIHQIDKQHYTMTQAELMAQVSLFREENNLLLGSEFKMWLTKKYLLSCSLQMLFMDYIKLKKHFLVSYNYNNYFVNTG